MRYLQGSGMPRVLHSQALDHGGRCTALRLCLQALVEEQLKTPFEVADQDREQRDAAEAACELMRKRRKRQAAKDREEARLQHVETALEQMSAEEAAMAAWLKEEQQGKGGSGCAGSAQVRGPWAACTVSYPV